MLYSRAERGRRKGTDDGVMIALEKRRPFSNILLEPTKKGWQITQIIYAPYTVRAKSHNLSQEYL